MRPPSHMPLAERITAPERTPRSFCDSARSSTKRTRSGAGSFACLSVMRVAASAIGEST
jgi:hypothetical protein